MNVLMLKLRGSQKGRRAQNYVVRQDADINLNILRVVLCSFVFVFFVGVNDDYFGVVLGYEFEQSGKKRIVYNAGSAKGHSPLSHNELLAMTLEVAKVRM
jgi:hypothetical protein